MRLCSQLRKEGIQNNKTLYIKGFQELKTSIMSIKKVKKGNRVEQNKEKRHTALGTKVPLNQKIKRDFSFIT